MVQVDCDGVWTYYDYGPKETEALVMIPGKIWVDKPTIGYSIL